MTRPGEGAGFSTNRGEASVMTRLRRAPFSCLYPGKLKKLETALRQENSVFYFCDHDRSTEP